MSIGRVFHNEAAAVSIKRLLYFTEISCLLGQSRFSKFCMYSGVSPCKDLKLKKLVNSLNWHRFTVASVIV